MPVYDGTKVGPVDLSNGDSQVLVGIGPSGGPPVAYVCLCPCEGVQGLVRDLQEAAAVAAENHLGHSRPMTASERLDL